jgi:hypothetical protein
LLFRPPLQWMLGSECKNLKRKLDEAGMNACLL